MTKRVAIIGGGSSGLTAVKCCLDEGFEPVCFERYSDIGGIWNYTDNSVEGRASVYKSCTINTSKEMMAYSDFPMPTEFPPFMPHHILLKYLRQYVKHFNLAPHIHFNTSVETVRQAPDYETTGRWVVSTRNDAGVTSEQTFDAVMVCTGHHSKPYRPTFPGEEVFKGTKFHSQQYRTPECFNNKRVLVIGIGNSAVDIAVEASNSASQVFLSTRRGAWVVGRMGVWGLPNDMLANNRALFHTGKKTMQWMVEKMANLKCDHEVYGLKPLHRGLQAHPTINDDLPHKIIRGSVKMKGNVSRFTENGVYFDDNTYEDIDIVVMATGYEYVCPFLDKSVLSIEKNRTSLYKYVFPPHLTHPSLAIVGLVQAVGAVMPLAEIQSRWFCRVVKGACQLPAKEVMMAEIAEKERQTREEYLNTPRHALETMWVPYMDEVAEEFGAKPAFWKLALKDFSLALRCFFGPCVPAQYRLQGPHTWEGAKHTIEQTFTKSKTPLTTRKVQDKPKKNTDLIHNRIAIFNQQVEKLAVDKSLLVYLLKVLLFVFLLSCVCL